MRTDKKRISTRLMAALLAGGLAAGMVGTNALATTGIQSGSGNPMTSVTVNKKVLTDGNTYAPKTTFNFEVKTGAPGEHGGKVVYEGKEGGLKAGTGAEFAPVEGTISNTYTSSGTLLVDASKFPKAGIYHYTVKEKENNYDGIQTDSTVYDVYVYVYVKEDGTRYVGDVASTKTVNGKATKADLTFSNNYGAEGNDSTHDVIIRKVITGNQANKGDTFTVNVTVNGADGEMYKVVVNENTAGASTDNLVSGSQKSFMVTDNTTIHIYGLSEKDTVTATETANTDGYSAEYSKAKQGKWESTNLINANASILKDGAEAIITNTKDVPSPTGIVINYGPYILMIALAGSMAVFFLRRKNRKEEA